MTPLATPVSIVGGDYVNAEALDAQIGMLTARVNRLVSLANNIRAAYAIDADTLNDASVRWRMLAETTRNHISEMVRVLVSVQAQAAIIPAAIPAQAVGGDTIGGTDVGYTFTLLGNVVPDGRWTFTVPGGAQSRYRIEFRVRACMPLTYGSTTPGAGVSAPNHDLPSGVWRESAAYGTLLPPGSVLIDTKRVERGCIAPSRVYGYVNTDHLWFEAVDPAAYRFYSTNWRVLEAETAGEILLGAAPEPMDKIVEMIVTGGSVVTIGYDTIGGSRSLPLSTKLPPDDDPRFPYQPGSRSLGAVQIDLLAIEPFIFNPDSIDISEISTVVIAPPIQLPQGGVLEL